MGDIHPYPITRAKCTQHHGPGRAEPEFTWLPGYLEGEQHISIARTGYLASTPLVCSIVGSFCGGYASDRLIARGVPIVQARKLPASLGYLGSVLFTAFAAMSTAPATAIVWISLAMFSLWFAVAAKWTLITAVSPQGRLLTDLILRTCHSAGRTRDRRHPSNLDPFQRAAIGGFRERQFTNSW